jgi:transcriptional antiterminator RfaH
VPDQIVAALRAREDERGLVLLDLRPSFRAGDKICILDGALAGCFGLYEGLKDSERVAVLLNLLGRKVRVTVEVERVAAV